jgi:beta-lactamase class A
MRLPLAALGLMCCLSAASAGSLNHAQLAASLERTVIGFDGEIGVCVRDAAGTDCIHGAERFPMQSVMKLVVAAAVLTPWTGKAGDWRTRCW